MTAYDLRSDKGLQAACEALGGPEKWGATASEWTSALADTLRWVRAADEGTRSTREFQERLWEDNHVASIGQGNIPVDRALDDEQFRRWLAGRSMVPLPPTREERLLLLSELYRELKERLQPFMDKKTPHLKIFRVIAVLYPEAMTTVASSGALRALVKAMGADRLEPVERHVWVRDRLDGLLGIPDGRPEALATRMSLPWMLYERFVQLSDELRTEDELPGGTPTLVPLPAARRRRGLTAVRGLFPAVLSTLEFVREGVTREELIDFLRAAAPDSKASSLGVTINAYQGELAVIRMENGQYVLTERGENVLESQDPSYLADWLLTRILGVDKALVELRERGPLPPQELVTAVRTVNPAWKTDFIAQAIVSWLRSMGVIHTTADWKHALTVTGREWAARVHWVPEGLPPDTVEPLPPTPLGAPPDRPVALPLLTDIIAGVRRAGHFAPELVARLHAGLWSHERRHFAILTGLSGSGKTLLAREYARAITEGGDRQQLFTLPVQPGWYDPGALLGFTNPLRGDSYVRTPFLEFFLAAAADPRRPYVAVLDEMNLSHPEQYMAPLLSAMETGDAVALHTEGEFFDGVPSGISYPKNLVLIGTVNMDETTHGLSDKVLDRAFVIEFWDIDLSSYPRWGSRGLNSEHEARTRDLLTALMEALAPARLHFGWRVVDEVLDFLVQASSAQDALSFDKALDGVIYAKVLPKLRGEDGPRLRQALAACEETLGRFDLGGCRAKVAELGRDLETTGNARFWR